MGSPSIVGIRVSVLHLGSDRNAPLTKRPRGILIANESRTPKNYRRHSSTKLFPTLTDWLLCCYCNNQQRTVDIFSRLSWSGQPRLRDGYWIIKTVSAWRFRSSWLRGKTEWTNLKSPSSSKMAVLAVRSDGWPWAWRDDRWQPRIS